MGKKKKLGSDPLDSIDILKGPAQDTSKDTGKNAGDNASKNAGKNTGKKTSRKTGKMTSHTTGDIASQEASQMTSHKAGNMTSHAASVLDIPAKSKLRKMTYYFREDQLKELDKLSKKTGRDRSELARMAIDILLDSVQKK